MQTIALVNQKGGSGKSTYAECLAVAAYLDGKAVAILDIDPQGSSYKWSKRRTEADPPVLSVTPANYEDEWNRLKAAGADLVVFDTPARLDEATGKAIELADLVIVPAKATVKDLERISATLDLVFKRSETKAIITLNQLRANGSRTEDSRQFLQNKHLAVCPHGFGFRVAFEDADNTGQTPQETEPKGKAAEEIQMVYQYTKRILNQITKEAIDHEPKKVAS
jgi:chromosome partitioning protein